MKFIKSALLAAALFAPQFGLSTAVMADQTQVPGVNAAPTSQPSPQVSPEQESQSPEFRWHRHHWPHHPGPRCWPYGPYYC